MLINDSGTVCVSNLGWVDQGSLWVYRIGVEKPRRLPLSPASWLQLSAGRNDHFAAVHRLGDDRLRLTAHRYDDPGQIVSAIDFAAPPVRQQLAESVPGSASGAPLGAKFLGEVGAWSFLPRAYMGYAFGAYQLLLVDASTQSATVQTLAWFAESYDVGYQAITGAVEIPGSPLLALPIHRDSSPVLYDLEAQARVGRIHLSDHSAGPQLYFRRKSRELWAGDLNTLLRVELNTWRVLGRLVLQEHAQHLQLWIGKFSFDREEELCLVARPFSGDAVAVQAEKFEVTHQAALGRQPLKAVLAQGDRVIARDWKTGKLLEGTLKGSRRF